MTMPDDGCCTSRGLACRANVAPTTFLRGPQNRYCEMASTSISDLVGVDDHGKQYELFAMSRGFAKGLAEKENESNHSLGCLVL